MYVRRYKRQEAEISPLHLWLYDQMSTVVSGKSGEEKDIDS
jgi:hypothetical protein